MEIKSVVNNGVQIPNECTCIWCGSKMRRGGANRMGAVVKQQELLHKERNLQQAISCLRDRRKFASLQSIDSVIDFVADLYDLSIDEVKRTMDGEEYWCV